MNTAPFGKWTSPITAEKIAEKTTGLYDLHISQGEVYGTQMRPSEKGRHALVKYLPDGKVQTILPLNYSARTRVHEYGGSSFTIHQGIVYFINYQDQNLYKMRIGEEPTQLTHQGIRFAELTVINEGILAIAEQHFEHQEAKNFLALIDPNTGHVTELASGYDFYGSPSVFQNEEGTKIAWISWHHPNMPWNSTELWIADLKHDHLTNQKQIQPNAKPQSYQQPRWDKEGNLIFLSDANNWWNFYQLDKKTLEVRLIYSQASDFGEPLWQLGLRTYAFHDNNIVSAFAEDGITHLGILNPKNGTFTKIKLPYTHFEDLWVDGEKVYFIAGSPTLPNTAVEWRIPTNTFRVMATSTSIDIPENYVSIGQHISFPTPSRQQTAHAFFYAPKNPEFQAPAGSLPPLVVLIHGGPTAAASNILRPAIQFWTSRGFAVADVNYGGSTGYGRAYREALERENDDAPGYWGDVDIKDCIACVDHLAKEKLIDPEKVAIRGGSAGGYTTLAALATSSAFKAGTSLYGVSDLMALAQDTHKFESRYLDRLIGALPKHKAVYDARSPINLLERFKAPLLVLQGDEDKVVPVNQAEKMVEALKARGVRVEYKLYQGEQHGFRKAETIIDSLARELAFYLSVFYP